MLISASRSSEKSTSLSDQIWSVVMKPTFRVSDPSSVGQTRAYHSNALFDILSHLDFRALFVPRLFITQHLTNGTNSSVTDEDICSSWHCNWERVISGGILFFSWWWELVLHIHTYIELDWWWDHKCAVLTISIYLAAYLYVGLVQKILSCIKVHKSIPRTILARN